MKFRIRCVFLSVLLLLGGRAVRAESVCFAPGEKVTYKAWYNWGFIWLSAGWIDFEVATGRRDGRETWLLSGAGSTYPSYDHFFRVRDTLRSEVDPMTLEPFWAYKHAHEGKWNGNDDFTFRRLALEGDSVPGPAWEVRTVLRRKSGLNPVVIDTTRAGGFDILTTVYRLRTLPLDSLLLADPYVLPMRLDDGEYTLYLRYQGEESVKLHKGGTYDCYLFHMTLVEGSVFKKGDYIKIWLTKDERRLPVQLEAPIVVGSVKALLSEN